MSQTPTRSAWKSFWKNVTRFEPERIAWRIGLRNSIGVLVPLLAGSALGHPAAGLIMATGALNVAFRDSQAPYKERAAQLFAASLIAGVAVTAGILCGRNNLIAILVAGVGAFAAGILVAISQQAADLGVTSIVLLVIYSAAGIPARDAALAGIAAFLGGLLQATLSVASWPLRRHDPERRVVAALYDALAAAALTPAAATESPIATTQAVAAQATLGHDSSIARHRFRFLVSQAERARITLVALARIQVRLEREQAPAATLEPVEQGLRSAARALSGVSIIVSGHTGDVNPTWIRELTKVSETLRLAAADDRTREVLLDARVQMDALAGQLRAALDVALATGHPVPSEAPQIVRGSALRFLDTIRATDVTLDGFPACTASGRVRRAR